jgi:phage baseplate assembly protein W
MRPRSRSWRFRVPRLDAPGEPVGFVIDPAGAIDTVADDESVRQSLLMLISTRPGERVMRPEYGCDLHRLVFSPNDDTTAGLAIHFVRQAVERWEPRVEILRVDANRATAIVRGDASHHADDDRDEARDDDRDVATHLAILLEYRVRATLQVDSIEVDVDLQEGVLP